MKKLLSILLLCFCFSATAKNASTIQQLLDEGVTIGELLDAGLLPNDLNGKFYQGGYIFNIDTLNGIGKVVAPNEQYNTLLNIAQSNGVYDTWPIPETTPGHGYQIKVTDYILDFNICE